MDDRLVIPHESQDDYAHQLSVFGDEVDEVVNHLEALCSPWRQQLQLRSPSVEGAACTALSSAVIFA